MDAWRAQLIGVLGKALERAGVPASGAAGVLAALDIADMEIVPAHPEREPAQEEMPWEAMASSWHRTQAKVCRVKEARSPQQAGHNEAEAAWHDATADRLWAKLPGRFKGEKRA